jgi:hypothetical protein
LYYSLLSTSLLPISKLINAYYVFFLTINVICITVSDEFNL